MLNLYETILFCRLVNPHFSMFKNSISLYFFLQVTEMEVEGWKIWAVNLGFFGNSGWKFNPWPYIPQAVVLVVKTLRILGQQLHLPISPRLLFCYISYILLFSFFKTFKNSIPLSLERAFNVDSWIA